jgi:hypothetical protein
VGDTFGQREVWKLSNMDPPRRWRVEDIGQQCEVEEGVNGAAERVSDQRGAVVELVEVTTRAIDGRRWRSVVRRPGCGAGA